MAEGSFNFPNTRVLPLKNLIKLQVVTRLTQFVRFPTNHQNRKIRNQMQRIQRRCVLTVYLHIFSFIFCFGIVVEVVHFEFLSV